MVMRGVAMAGEGVPAEPEAVRCALSGNLCRCTGYRGIVDAVCEGLQQMRAQTQGRMNSFDYRRPRNVAEAIGWLRDDPEAKLLAGGQSLLAAMKLRFAAPTLLIDLQGLPELTALREDGGGLWIGAMCTHAAVAASPLVHRIAPMLAGWPTASATSRCATAARWAAPSPMPTRPPAGPPA
jgi:xanthine dehydrogenase iron-sulfur cluster and FAD-binding subunit A